MTLKAKIKKKASPSDSEFTNMLRLAKESDSKALEEICLYFAPLINGIAVGLSEKGVCFHYPFDDLIQEGNIGLFDAIKKAQDIDNIGHFVGYAKMRIYGQMMDALRTYSNTDRFINKGCSLYRKISKNK